MRLIALAIGLSSMLNACQASSDSDLQHVVGKTRRTPQASLKSCRESLATEPTIAAGNTYIAAIGRYLMDANPQTFADVFSPDKFCFRVRESAEINADASAENGMVTFYTGMLKVMPNDAHVAAVMAHELAHVLMQHRGDRESEDMTKDPRWQAKGPALKQRIAALDESQEKLKAQQSAMYAEQAELESALDAAQTMRHSWGWRSSWRSRRLVI